MIRIYCQYSVGGFKIFNLNSFPHTIEGQKYVTKSEIKGAKEAEQQDIFVTRNYNCQLDLSIMYYFSSYQVSCMILHGCGESHDETTLFLRDKDNISYAFASKEPEDIRLMTRIAQVWTLGNKKRLTALLANMVSEKVIDDKMVLAFDETIWQQISQLAEKETLSSSLKKVEQGKKNLMANVKIDKTAILHYAKINAPLSSFVSIPGSEYIKRYERNRKILYYGIGTISTLAIGCALYYYCKQ